MRILSWEEFVEFYERNGKLPNQARKPKNPLNEKQLQTKYEKYLRSMDKERERSRRLMEKAKKAEGWFDNKDWEAARKLVYARDGGACRLMEVLNDSELRDLKLRAGRFFLSKIDPAHIFGRGAYPHLYSDPDNVVLLNRYSHSMLDSGKHPIYGDPISVEEKENWWRRIVGNKHYDALVEKARKR